MKLHQLYLQQILRKIPMCSGHVAVCILQTAENIFHDELQRTVYNSQLVAFATLLGNNSN